MELRTEPIATLDDRRHVAAIARSRDDRRPIVAREAVRKIEIFAAADPETSRSHIDAAPAHVRNGTPGGCFQCSHSARNNAEAGGVLFVAAIEQQLHAKANSQRRLSQRG